jgi:hypothetical protein
MGATVKALLEEHDPAYLFTASALIDDRYTYSPFYDEDYFSRLFGIEETKTFTGQTRFLPLVLEPQIGNKYFKLETINKYLFPIGRKYEDLYMIARMTLDIDKVVGSNIVTHFYNTTERSTRITMTPNLRGISSETCPDFYRSTTIISRSSPTNCSKNARSAESEPIVNTSTRPACSKSSAR